MIYVDDMFKYEFGRFAGMRMSHMIATDENELHDMAREIGIERRHYQRDHYDICMSKRNLAISLGAMPITYRQLGFMAIHRRRTGIMPSSPEIAEALFKRRREIERLIG
jgi:hypothetical protein